MTTTQLLADILKAINEGNDQAANNFGELSSIYGALSSMQIALDQAVEELALIRQSVMAADEGDEE